MRISEIKKPDEYRLPRHLARGPIAWMACNPVAANLLMLILMVGGMMMAARVTKDIFPEFTLNIVTVSVSYLGATPQEMEKSVTLAIEQAVENIEGIKETSAVISSGFANVRVELEDNIDGNVALQEIKAEIDRITTFPQESETPVVSLMSTKRGVLTLLLTGSDDMLVLNYWANIIRDELSQAPQISQVELEGIRDSEIHVEISQDNLRRYGLKLSDVALAISVSALDQGGGTLKTSGGDILMRMNERRDYAAEFSNIAIRTNADGSRLLLDDIATISEGFEDIHSWAEFNGQAAVMISVFKTEDQAPATVVNAAMSIVEKFNASLPGNLNLDVRNNSAKIYQEREELLKSNAIMGVVLVFLCLALFLRPSLAFWVSLGIPVSILGSFWFFAPFNLTVNIISMFAFIVTLGIVVDDAIVVGENVSAWQERGVHPLEAAVRGVKEVSSPVIFSILTNMLTFLPILFVPGVMGTIWSALPLVVIAVFTCSLLESLFVLPAHLAHALKKGKNSENIIEKLAFVQYLLKKQEKFSKGFMYFVEYRFGPFLNKVLDHRYITLTISVAILLCTAAYVKSGRMGFDLMPRTESDFAFAEAALPAGAPDSEVERVKMQLLNAAQKIIAENGGKELSTGIYTRGHDTSITMRVFLVESDERPISTTEFTTKWRNEVGIIAGVENLFMQADSGGPGSGKALTVRLSHRNTDTLNIAAQDVGNILNTYAGVGDIDTGISQTKRQFDLKLLPIAEQLGFTAREVASQVRAAFEGTIALRQQREHDEVTVRVLLPKEERKKIATFEDLILRSPSGQEVLLRDIVQVNDTRADSVIRHTNGRRTASVSASVTPSSATGLMMETVQTTIMPDVLARYPGLAWEFGGRQTDMRDSANTMIYGLLMALLGIYALLAIPFRSYTQPLIIMMAIPFGVVGAIAGHVIMGYSLSVISLFGIVALSGVVVNDSLVLIDFANTRLKEGLTPYFSIRQAAIQRFRPILLTTLTTFVGLMPIMFETSRQARMMIPVALSLGFGILFATAICLLIVPSLYLALDDIKKLIKR